MDGDYNQASDETLKTRLIRFEEDIRSLVQPTVVGISMHGVLIEAGYYSEEQLR